LAVLLRNVNFKHVSTKTGNIYSNSVSLLLNLFENSLL